VGLLILNKPKGPAMQWMWIPSLGRDRRIAPQDRGGQVFDADLTFEDLEERSLDNYFIGESKTDSSQGRPCFRIELTPKDPRTSQYSASEVWVDQQRFVILKVESKKQAKVVRVMEFQDIRDVQGIPTPHRLDAFSPATGSRTILTTQSVVYNAPLSASEFTREAMKRAQ
jgi:hypothetical protein